MRDDMRHRRDGIERSRLAVGLLGIIVSLGVVGCERWPWESKTKAVPTPGASTEKPTAQIPGPASVAPQDRVAVVNHADISTADVELATKELQQFVQSVGQTWKPLSTQDLPDALDLHDVMNNLVDGELKAQDARARGLDQSTDMRQRLTYLLRGFYAQEWDRWQRERAAPTEEGIHKFYEQNKAAFVEPERVRARQIVIKTLAEAEAVRARAIQGETFAQLAAEMSVGPGKEKGGDIGWHLKAVDKERLTLMGAQPTETVFFPQLEPVAFALEKSQVSQPVKGPDGQFYLVLLDERKPSRQESELEVHDPIKELLTAQNLQKQLEQLREKAQIERSAEHLDGVKQ